MGFIFRNSLHAGPFRITFNKSGVGSSTGAPSFLPGVDRDPPVNLIVPLNPRCQHRPTVLRGEGNGNFAPSAVS
jgi:hypothetical protein